MISTELIIVAQLVATLYMTGLIWFVQLVHYPLFAAVPPEAFTAYEARHTRRTVWAVAPPMGVEALTAALLALTPPAELSATLTGSGLVLVIVIWLSTSLLQVPCHRHLSRGFSETVHHRLVVTNWIRTVAWSLRAVLVVWMAVAA